MPSISIGVAPELGVDIIHKIYRPTLDLLYCFTNRQLSVRLHHTPLFVNTRITFFVYFRLLSNRAYCVKR